jgi:hypothetical protein
MSVAAPPTLTIRLKKTPDAPPVLTGVRADGSATWQHSNAAFPEHDLVHYCVESALGFRDAFFGLIAQGWNLGDFGNGWPRGPLPAEAAMAEAIVGEVWRTFLSREPLSADELNGRVAAHRAERQLAPARQVTTSELQAIQSRLGELALQWRTLPHGGTLELIFPAAGGT